MPIEICQIQPDDLARYAQVPIRFMVTSVFRIEAVQGGLGGFLLVEEPVDPPYMKDYDTDVPDEPGPVGWPQQFDVSKWGFFLALDGSRAVGGAAVAVDTPGVHMLEGSRDLAVLWDIRVLPEERGRGIGSRLFRHAADWSRARGCKRFKVETQNVNVAACRFYARQGCTLGAIHRFGYLGCPPVAHEAMMLWYMEL